MKKSWSSPFLEGVEKAFLDLRESYQENPLKYMNKWDVIADLHQRLSHLSRLDLQLPPVRGLPELRLHPALLSRRSEPRHHLLRRP